MRRFIKNTSLVLLLALFGSRADSTSLRQTTPLPIPSDNTRVVQDFGHAKEGTKESFSEGRYTKAIHQFTPSPVAPYRVEVPSCSAAYDLRPYPQQTSFRSSLYYSSFCNKAPPVA
jgi:hypothetical protein